MKSFESERTPLIKNKEVKEIKEVEEGEESEEIKEIKIKEEKNDKNYQIFNFLILIFLLILLFFYSFNFFINKKLIKNKLKTSNLNFNLKDTISVSVYKNIFTNRYEVIQGRKDLQSDAIGIYQTNIEISGWNYLEIEGTPQEDTMEKYLQSMKAMGYLEGYLTWQQIEQFYPNYYQGLNSFLPSFSLLLLFLLFSSFS